MRTTLNFLMILLIISQFSCKNEEKKFKKNQINNSISCFCSENINPENKQSKHTKICIPEPTKNFGNVGLSRSKLNHSYDFFNAGNEPLIIQNVRGSGGHMPSRFPREPIPVGGKGVIETEYYAEGKKYSISSRWVIEANTIPSQIPIHIKADLGFCSDKINHEKSVEKLTVLCLPETEHDLGQISKKQLVDTFTIQNTGNSPLIIKNITSSAGTAKWPSKPIPINTSGQIFVTSNEILNEKSNFQITWTIQANTKPEKSKIKIRGEVLNK